MKRFLLGSVAFAALFSAGQIANAQAPSNPPAAAERPASEPAEKKAPPPKAQNESKEAPGPNKPSAGNSSDQKSAPPKAASESKEPDRTKSSQEKTETPKAASESKDSETPSKTTSEKTGSPKAGSESKEPVKSTTSPPPEKSSPAKASSETKDAPSKSGATQPAPSAPSKDNAETKPPTPPNTPTSAPPAANNAAPPAGAAKTGETKEGPSTSQQNVATTAPNAPAVAPEKAAKINEVISREKVQSVDNVNFSVSVGVNIPSTVTVHPLPPTIVEIVPEYRGYDYIVVREEIVIIEPRTRRIITVVHRGGSGGIASAAQSSTRISLSPDRRRTIKQTLVRSSSPRPAQTSTRLAVGAEVPQTYEIREFPAEVLQESPELRDYEYVLDEDVVVVVDRRERRVIEIID